MSLVREQLTDAVTFAPGDCLDVLPTLPENSIDSCVTDPPYHLTSIVKRFGADNAVPAKDYSEEREGATGAYARASAGFMGKKWDGGDVAFRVATWRAIYRVLKPGAHLIAFSGTRTYHRMVCAIEDAGFEVRDQLAWVYGSGFPKSHNVSKAIDRAAGAERAVVGSRLGRPGVSASGENYGQGFSRKYEGRDDRPNPALDITAPATAAAARWDGWGTALKPAQEPIVLARKPLGVVTSAELHTLTNCDHWCSERTDKERKVIVRSVRALHPGVRSQRILLDPKTRNEVSREDAGAYQPFSETSVCANVLKWGTGALNVDGCRVAGEVPQTTQGASSRIYGGGKGLCPDGQQLSQPHTNGRWPANLIHDGSEEVLAAFPDAKGAVSNGSKTQKWMAGTDTFKIHAHEQVPGYADSGSAARFFYAAKADQDDRLGSKHPTVKPVDPMQWLVRLVTQKGGTTLDPFAGTGTTGEAALREGCKAVLIELEEEYQADIRRRMKLVFAGPDERVRESFKVAGKIQSHETLPLFRGGS